MRYMALGFNEDVANLDEGAGHWEWVFTLSFPNGVATVTTKDPKWAKDK